MFHLLKRKFDSEITARDNDAIGLFDDLVDILAAAEILDFRNDRNPFPGQKIPDSSDVVGVVNERREDDVDAVVDAELDVGLVDVRKRFVREIDAGKVAALVRAEPSASLDLSKNKPAICHKILFSFEHIITNLSFHSFIGAS